MRNQLKLSFLFICSIVILHFILRELRYKFEFIMHQYWPFSIFLPKMPMLIDSITIIAIIILAVGLWKNFKAGKPFWQQVLIVWSIVIASNLLQGVEAGFITPIKSDNDDGFDYWQDTLIIHDPSDVFTHYVTLQPTLGYHSRVHPPLALFTYFYLKQCLQEPWLLSLALSVMSMLSIFFLRSWLTRFVPDKNARYVALLFGLTSAFQIYSLATIDVVIAASFIGTIWAFDQKLDKNKLIRASIFLSISMLLTFGVAWLIALLVCIDYIQHRNVKKSIKVFALAGFFGLILYISTGYSYITSFFTAASFEGTKNFFHSPATLFSYMITRVQDILEPAVFLGPFMLIQIARSWKTNLKSNYLSQISLISFLIFCGFLSTGAYYTGETARAALYLIIPLIAGIAPIIEISPILFSLVLGQTVLMQLFGYYTW